jgi:nitroreductase
VILLLVTDISRYKDYNPENSRATKRMNDMGTLDAGIVSQNIGLFCAGAGLGTVPRIGMDNKSIRLALDLKDTQIPWLNNPVGYPKYD